RAHALNAIYEEDFLGFSYGFRPGRGPHDALDALSVAITSRKVNYILDADVRDFFGSVSQDWLVSFLEHRVGDKRIIRLIRKWLKAGHPRRGDRNRSRQWNRPRCGDLTTSRQHLPALRLRSVGRTLATARGPWRRNRRALRRRSGGRLRA